MEKLNILLTFTQVYVTGAACTIARYQGHHIAYLQAQHDYKRATVRGAGKDELWYISNTMAKYEYATKIQAQWPFYQVVLGWPVLLWKSVIEDKSYKTT